MLHFGNLSIRTQISLTSMVAFVGFLLTLLIGTQTLQDVGRNNQLISVELEELSNVIDIQREITLARLSEKEFLRTKSTTSLALQKYHIDEAREDLIKLLFDNSNESLGEMEKLNAWMLLLDEYQNKFGMLVDESLALGFSTNTGLLGVMEFEVGNVASIIEKESGELYLDLVELILAEHQFRQTLHREDFDAWQESYLKFNSDIKNVSFSQPREFILGPMRRYGEAVAEFATRSKNVEMLSIEVNGVSLDLVGKSSELFEHISDEVTEASADGISGAARNLKYLAFAVFVVGSTVFIVGHRVGHAISDPIELFSGKMEAIAGGNLLVEVPDIFGNNELGRMASELVILRDTARRKEIADAEIKKFRATLDSTQDAVFMFRPVDFKFIFINKTGLKQVGWSSDDYSDKTPSDMIPAFDPERFRKLTNTLVNGTEKTLTVENIGFKDNPVELSIELFDGPNDAEPRFVLTSRDISERKAAENELVRFKTTLDLIVDEVYILSPDTLEFTYVNNAAGARLGLTPAEFIGETPALVNPNFEVAKFRELVAPVVLGTQNSVTYEAIHLNADGGEIPVEVTVQIIHPENEDPRFIAVSRDITDRKAADKAKAEFIAIISHELRTPMTSVKGSLGLVLAGVVGEVNEKVTGLLQIALNNSDRLIRLINDILDIEKVESGKMEFHMEEMDLSRLVETAVEANASYGEALGVGFTVSGIDKPTIISGDSDRLHQVLANLMSNAAKFSDKGSSVEIRVDRKEGQAIVSVIDTGSGIPECAQATLFDKFSQADSSDMRSKGGTGLGLSIARNMIQAHGGEISFVSKEGKGTTFTFTLDLLS